MLMGSLMCWLVGAPAFDNGQAEEGRAFLFLGGESGLSFSAAWTAESNQPAALFGGSVASAGDINGDGFGDVLVGASHYDNGQTDEGRAYLYLGSGSGLALTPAWTAESNQTNADFGHVVSGAGDVNGDGYADVVVTASRFLSGESSEGKVFLYLGSPSGLSATASWTAESNQADALFGESVTGAGDVNGDGYADLVVGACSFDNGENEEGRLFLYLGGPGGPSTAPNWSVESNQSNAYLGESVAFADTNGDGFSDVVAGAYTFTNGEQFEGRAFLYLGGQAGLATTPSWTDESNQVEAEFGQRIAGVGDVNGDGFDDVVVGAHFYDNGAVDEGAAFLYLGSRLGLSLSAAWGVEGGQTGARFATSVGRAGDVNRDGFADFIVGAQRFGAGQFEEGRAFLFLGGDGAPGSSMGLEQHLGGLRLGPAARGVSGAFYGRVSSANWPTSVRSRLQVELKPIGRTFDGGGTVFSGAVQGAVTAVILLPTLPSGRYHWRAREVSDDSRGRWVSFGGNSESEADFVVVGSADAGPADAGPADAGPADAGQADAGPADAGTSMSSGPLSLSVGCGCQSESETGSGGLLLLLFALSARRRAGEDLR
jgi:MYXO-CTERM domain-containing protein